MMPAAIAPQKMYGLLLPHFDRYGVDSPGLNTYRIVDYPNLSAYLDRLLSAPRVAATVSRPAS